MQHKSKSPSPQREHVERTEEHDAHSAAGASPCNTAPATCRILRYGIDSLYLSFKGELSEEGSTRLETTRAAARADNEAGQILAQISVCDHQFQASASGGKLYKYALNDYAFRIQIRSKQARHIPFAAVQIRSDFLQAVGVEQAVSQLRLILSYFGTLTDTPTVSRIDLFADFLAPLKVDEIETRAWVTRAKRKGLYWMGSIPTGWSIGEGAMMARLYDKTEEVKASGKHWLLDLYDGMGWNGVDPVFRLEFQYRNDVLRELNTYTYPAILDGLGGLWRYAAGAWLRLTIPDDDDNTRSRWPIHPLWRELQAVPWETPLEVSRVPVMLGRVPSEDYLCRSYFAALTAYMGARSLTDPLHAAQQLFEHTRSYYEDQADYIGCNFNDRAINRAAKKAMGYGVVYPVIAQAAQRQQDEAVISAYRKRSGR